MESASQSSNGQNKPEYLALIFTLCCTPSIKHMDLTTIIIKVLMLLDTILSNSMFTVFLQQ
jgi:hypothetical protein